MNPGESLELLARGAAVGAFLGLALLCIRGSRNSARLTGALFCLGTAAHTLTQLPYIQPALSWFWVPIWAFSVAGAGLFWAFALEMFEDRAALDLRRFAPAIALLAVGLGAALAHEQTQRWLYLLHNLLGAALIVHALVAIARGWRGDLVEARRRLRGPILGIASIYALAVIAVQTGELFVGSADLLSPLAAAALFALAVTSLAAFGNVDSQLFGAPVPARRESGSMTPPLDNEAVKAATALQRIMEQERAYREEGLTISALAERLGLPEHRLRRPASQYRKALRAVLQQSVDVLAADRDEGDQAAKLLRELPVVGGFPTESPVRCQLDERAPVTRGRAYAAVCRDKPRA